MNVSEVSDTTPSEHAPADVAPPVGITTPQLLAQDAAAGKRGAALRLMVWIMENDPRAIVAVCRSRATSFLVYQDTPAYTLHAWSRYRLRACLACGNAGSM